MIHFQEELTLSRPILIKEFVRAACEHIIKKKKHFSIYITSTLHVIIQSYDQIHLLKMRRHRTPIITPEYNKKGVLSAPFSTLNYECILHLKKLDKELE